MKSSLNKNNIKSSLQTKQIQERKNISITKSIVDAKQQLHPSNLKQQISKASTHDTLSLSSLPSNISKSLSQISDQQVEEFADLNITQKKKTINDYLGKNQMYIVFKYFSYKILYLVRETCKSWKLLIDSYFIIQTPLLIAERNQLEQLFKHEMDSESSHTRYVRAFKKVSLGHDLIFNLNKNDAEKFYLLKDKSDYIKEIRSITHQIIGKNVVEKNKEIKKYSAQYYIDVIPECKEVQVSDIPKDIILRMKMLFQFSQQISDESLQSISKYAYALKVLLSGYLHLYQEMNPQQAQKIRLDSIIQDMHTHRVFNKNKSVNQK